MADAAPAQAKPAKKKAPAKPKKPAAHPKYSEMIKAAITALKERGGSSRQAIQKYIAANYKVGDEKSFNAHLKMALRNGAKKGTLKQVKGSGASGSFRLGDKAEKKPKAKKTTKPKAAAKKPKAKKPKAAAKKASGEKKAVKKPKAKKPAAKKPAAKPKKAKTPKKASKPKAKKSPKKAAKKV